MPNIDRYSISLKALIKNKKWEILIMEKPKSSYMSWFYDFPWWRIDKNEREADLKEVLLREIKEELWENVKCEINEKISSYWRSMVPWKFTLTWEINPYLYLFFETEYLWGEIKISDEHLSYKWVKLEEIYLKKYFTDGLLEGLEKFE